MPFQHSGRKLQGNKSSYGPAIVIAINTARNKVRLDKEGTLIRQSFRGVSVVCSRLRKECKPARNTHKFDTPDAFWAFLDSQTVSHRTVWVIGHNVLADLTLLGFTHAIDKGQIKLSATRGSRNNAAVPNPGQQRWGLCVLDSPPTILGLRSVRTGGRITVVDIQNWHRTSITELGVTVGISSPDTEHWDELEIDWGLNTRIRATVIHDAFVELVGFVAANDLGMFRYSAAGQAMAAFRHKYYHNTIYIHDNLDIKKLERRAFFGGRTEVFRRGSVRSTVYQLDVNALYPYVMACGEFPTKLVEYGTEGSRGTELLATVPESMVASVLVQTRNPIYPVRKNRTVIYPTGAFCTCLCGSELANCANNGDIVRILEWSYYDRSSAFADYVAGLSEQRQSFAGSGQTLYANLCKLLLNALYGKFAQLAPQWVDCPDRLDMLPWTRQIAWDEESGEYTDFRSIGQRIQKRGKEKESAGSFVAIAGFVTSAARCYMNRLRAVCGAENCYYQGCDSLIVNAEGRDRLDIAGYLHCSEMGKLKVEMVSDQCDIFGCQDYRIGNKTVIAGRRPDGTYIDVGRMRQLRESGLASLFNGFATDTILAETLPWCRKEEYYKGVVQPDGWVSSIELTGEVSST